MTDRNTQVVSMEMEEYINTMKNDFEVDVLYFDEWFYMTHKILAKIDNDYAHIKDLARNIYNNKFCDSQNYFEKEFIRYYSYLDTVYSIVASMAKEYEAIYTADGKLNDGLMASYDESVESYYKASGIRKRNQDYHARLLRNKTIKALITQFNLKNLKEN